MIEYTQGVCPQTTHMWMSFPRLCGGVLPSFPVVGKGEDVDPLGVPARRDSFPPFLLLLLWLWLLFHVVVVVSCCC